MNLNMNLDMFLHALRLCASRSFEKEKATPKNKQMLKFVNGGGKINYLYICIGMRGNRSWETLSVDAP